MCLGAWPLAAIRDFLLLLATKEVFVLMLMLFVVEEVGAKIR